MSNKIYTVVGDPHLVHKTIDKMTQVCNLVEQVGNDVIWLGDMLDTKEVIRGKCLNFWTQYFQSSRLNHVIIVGNHDWFNLECEEHSLESLKSIPNVLVVDTLTKVSDQLYAIPYLHDQEKLSSLLAQVPDGVDLFAHLELKDFDFGNGRICESGMTFKSFKRLRSVITGHFHKYQKKNNVTYLGTPFSLSFGETNQVKYIGYYDGTEGDLELQETSFPRHVTCEVDCSDPNFEYPIIDARDHNRVILTGTREQVASFDKRVYADIPDIKFLAKVVQNESNVVISETSSNLQQFKEWATINNKPEPMISLGLEILSKAMEVGV